MKLSDKIKAASEELARIDREVRIELLRLRIVLRPALKIVVRRRRGD